MTSTRKETSVQETKSIIPFAKQSPKKMKTRGTYKGGWPAGAVVHYTAGRDAPGRAQSTINGGIENGYTYLCIDSTGEIVQAHPVDKWGYHAGKSAWKGFIGGLNDDLIGIEINNPGKLDEKNGILYTWYGEVVDRRLCRYVTQKDYGCPTGWYKKFTPEQERSLVDVLLWLHKQKPHVFKFDNVLGHHECAGLKGLGFWRKSDPGGSLSMSMDKFREYLHSLVVR